MGKDMRVNVEDLRANKEALYDQIEEINLAIKKLKEESNVELSPFDNSLKAAISYNPKRYP